MTLTEKVAYLKGLAEGLNLDKDNHNSAYYFCTLWYISSELLKY